MNTLHRPVVLYLIMLALIALVGFAQSWSLALAIMQLCLISAVMSLGVNMQWGYAGLFNAGVMGFAALGGIAAVLVSVPPVPGAWAAGGADILLAGLSLFATIVVIVLVRRATPDFLRQPVTIVLSILGLLFVRVFYIPGSEAIEAYEPAKYGFLGGAGLPIIFSWLIGGVFAAGAAWLVGKVTLGLRSDYLAIATLGISEIVIAILKYEDWLSRGVKNVAGLARPVPYEVNLQNAAWFRELALSVGSDLATTSGVVVKLCYISLFIVVLGCLLWLAERALNSPWGRMMRAIRDNRDAAEAMGKDVTARHLQVFILGSAVIGIAGAMLTTLDGQFTPGSYQPLRFTFLIWVMVVVGGSGNNWGSIIGAFLVWFVWVEAEPAGLWLMNLLTSGMPAGSALREHLIDAAPHLRILLMGIILLCVLRFNPKGLIPER